LFPNVGGKPLRAPLQPIEQAAGGRTKIWQLDASLHCSIVGTCLSTGALRTLVRRFSATSVANPSDHDLHGIAVSAVGQRGTPLAKQFQKALDRQHAAAIRRFGKAGSADELLHLWDEARRAGDIPGGYWATLTHPLATDQVVRRAFGDVHMLSHLVGGANRADIRHLHQIEEEKAALEDKLQRQQTQLRDSILSRDAKIRELSAMVAARIEGNAAMAEPDARTYGVATLNELIVDLRKRLDNEVKRRERAERRASELAVSRSEADRNRLALERDLEGLRGELQAAEAGLADLAEPGEQDDALDLSGITILYVGGRPHQIVRLRSLVERAFGQFVHHDGGIEERRDMLAGLVSRADVAVFPVDCISHDAALSLKRLCRQAGKPFVPLRSCGIASLLHGLRALERNSAAARPA
jgi:hypothetical protein